MKEVSQKSQSDGFQNTYLLATCRNVLGDAIVDPERNPGEQALISAARRHSPEANEATNLPADLVHL